jgi:hypothetical protein
MSKPSIILRSTYATCLALATVAHVLVDWRFGVLLDGLAPLGYPVGVRLYWASLVFLDPAAAILLFVRPRAGLVLCAAIIATDVLNNSWVAYHRSEFSPPVLDSAQRSIMALGMTSASFSRWHFCFSYSRLCASPGEACRKINRLDGSLRPRIKPLDNAFAKTDLTPPRLDRMIRSLRPGNRIGVQ